MHYLKIFNHGPVAGVSGSSHALRLSTDTSYLIDYGSLRDADTSGIGLVGRNARYIDFPLGPVRALIALQYQSRCSNFLLACRWLQGAHSLLCAFRQAAFNC